MIIINKIFINILMMVVIMFIFVWGSFFDFFEVFVVVIDLMVEGECDFVIVMELVIGGEYEFEVVIVLVFGGGCRIGSLI